MLGPAPTLWGWKGVSLYFYKLRICWRTHWSKEVMIMQCHNANPFWTQHTVHFLIHSLLGFYGFSSHARHCSMTSTVPLPLGLSACSSALLSQSPWHASPPHLCPYPKRWSAPRPHPTNLLYVAISSSL